MEKNRRNRVALLGALFVTGLVLAGLGTALGVGEVFQEIGKAVSVVTTGDQVTVYEDGKVVQNFTLPDGESYNYTCESSDGAIRIFGGKMTEEEMEKQQAEFEAEVNKWLEIAKNDSRVQALIEGKNYSVVSTGKAGEIGEENTAILQLGVEGKFYVVTIDLNNETVKSLEEQQSATGFSITTGPDGETKWSEGVPEGIHRPPTTKR
jgi:hypothetical protein